MRDLQLNEAAIAHGKVIASGVKWFAKHTKCVFELILDDGTARLHCRWWNLAYMEKYFALGHEVLVFGKVLSLKPRTIDHPETEVLEGTEETFIHLNRITPIYPLTEGLPQRWLRGLVWRALEKFESQIEDPLAATLENKKSAEITATAKQALDVSRGFPSRAQAIRMLHFPKEEAEVEEARRRLALDEFVALQCKIQRRRKNFETNAQALPCHGDNHLIKPFLHQLGFKLTEAQTRVLREIRTDMSGAHPMRRLLQGDVGSGKTVVAACSALMALESGYEVALMAPTEILAEQHFRNFSKWLRPLGVAVELQTGSRKTTPGRTSKPGLQNSSPEAHGHQSTRVPTLTVGTHALIEDAYAPERLGLVVIDEQHKFGVAQREKLVRKGRYPHLLVMTATPIPRTLGLTLYGELDVSLIDQSPPGRGRVQTFVRTADKLPQVWDFLRSKLGEGRQAYVVYPRVENSGQGELKAVTREFDNLKQALAPFHVGLLHGQMRPGEKEKVMSDFRDGAAQVLLATSLVEVGVDVPNATVMLIENAEQFGLAQLHQLRGRIGRGSQAAYCILVSTAKTVEARQRLLVLEKSNDGFYIAEADLKLRGPGELLGQEQSGMPKLRFGDLVTDLELITMARTLANHLVRV